MGAILGGTMRSPFTGIVFALELTHDVNMLLPLLVAVTIAHGFTVLTLKRSILTEKVARRGYHLSREYAVDPLEILFVREVMRTNIVTIASDTPIEILRQALHGSGDRRPQRLYPVVDGDRMLAGVVTRKELQTIVDSRAAPSVGAFVKSNDRTPTVAYPDEPLRVVVLSYGRHRADPLPGRGTRPQRTAAGYDRSHRPADRAGEKPRGRRAPREVVRTAEAVCLFVDVLSLTRRLSALFRSMSCGPSGPPA